MDETSQKSTMVAVFVTAFLDLVGFSIIFPLFPTMLEHYVSVEGPGSAVGLLAESLRTLSGGDSDFAVVVLFGGALGSLYSVLQFMFAPLWGFISDRTGRRPTLLITLSGTVASYVLWFFAGSFSLLIGARLLGGVMAGNISTASAVIADTTKASERSKGMAVIGIAVGIGFIFGPAIGGAASLIDLTELWPGSEAWGVNPFSAAAGAALVLSILNLALVAARLPETHPPDRRGTTERTRSANPIALFRSVGTPGVQRTNLVSFCYLTAFSAVEFTLVFLVVERFQFTPLNNAMMFVFVGLVIAAVQGGAVRRLAPRHGDRPLVIGGLATLLPGFILIGWSTNTVMLFAGLALMATGSAFATPCLGALVSRYAPTDKQGLALGLFRSMGALSRALGPVLGGVLYWKLGAHSPYAAGSVLVLLPFGLSLGLPRPP